MTGVADTRLLLTLEFPPTDDWRKKVNDFVHQELGRGLLVPSVVLAEYIRFAGSRIGEVAALTRISLLKQRGVRVVELGEEEAVSAGKLLLAYQQVPIADALIASIVSIGKADFVLTDDPHYKKMKIRTRWFQ
ncbi:MAG: PIN domain-containing protein [Thaumarchaeota archaeon]|nr:PIN domain-containing protein [Nitrososphaerota archaeon]